MNQPVILVDLDNTIYNWIDYFCPSFRGMVHALSKDLGIEEDVIIHDFRRVYIEKGTIEYAFAVQSLALCRSMPSPEIERLVRIAKGAFSRVREKNLQPYEGVRETLIWAVNEGIAVIAVTNAPVFQAQRRLRKLKLDRLFTGIAGWNAYEVPEDFTWTRKIKQNEGNGKYRTYIDKLWFLSANELKPGISGYERIMEELQVSAEKTYIIGDSLKKDIAPAVEIGAVSIWARYGQQCDSKNFDTLLKITNWSQEEISSTYQQRPVTPDFTVDSFAEIRKIVPASQLTLFV